MAEPLWSARALASLSAQDNYLRPLNSSAADAVLSEIARLATHPTLDPNRALHPVGWVPTLHSPRRCVTPEADVF